VSELRITDHALVRVLERICGLPIEALREQLVQALTPAAASAEAIGGGNYLIVSGGKVFVVRDRVVTTVLDRDNVHARFIALADDLRAKVG